MNSAFNYLSEKVANASFSESPFSHLLIKNFLSNEHFEEIVNDNQIHFEALDSNDALYSKLLNEGYEIINNFPGCINNWEDYKRNLLEKTYKIEGKPVEGYGMAFRLKNLQNPLLKNLIEYLNGDEFKKTLHEKFSISQPTTIISAVQKYLTGYEISPHPDWQMKALTYLLNLNKNSGVDNEDVHTHLLKFKPEYQWISRFWQMNKKVNRNWVPWDYCESVVKTNENNSFLIFKPNDNPPTLHAIKLNYNHLSFQRTQVYGNLNYLYKTPLTNLTYRQVNKYRNRVDKPLNQLERKIAPFFK